MKIASSIAALALCTLATNVFATTFQSSSGYQITPPDGFTLRPNAVSYDSGAVRADNRAFDTFFVGPHRETISVVVGNMPAQLTLPMLLQYMPQYLERAMNSKKTRIANSIGGTFQGKTKWRSLSKGYTTMGGSKAVTFLSRIEFGSAANAVLVRHVVVPRGTRLMTFCCTAPAKAFDKLAPAFNRTLTTVSWTK